MITDAQVHLWPANSPEFPWASNAAPHLPEPMPAERMLGLMDEAGVDRAIISPQVTAGRSPAYAIHVSKKYPKRFRVMPWFAANKPEQFDLLPRWLDTPGVCSLRLSLNSEDEMKMFNDGALEPLWKAVTQYRIPMAVFRREGCGVIEPVICKYPDMVVIVDHFNWATPKDRERKMVEMETLAKYPNVYIKVSALPRLTDSPPPYADMEPLIKRVHAAYGARRLMWGSDQTQIMGAKRGTFNDSVDIIRVSAAKYLPREDIAWILNGTAAKVLNWPAA